MSKPRTPPNKRTLLRGPESRSSEAPTDALPEHGKQGWAEGGRVPSKDHYRSVAAAAESRPCLVIMPRRRA